MPFVVQNGTRVFVPATGTAATNPNGSAPQQGSTTTLQLPTLTGPGQQATGVNATPGAMTPYNATSATGFQGYTPQAGAPQGPADPVNVAMPNPDWSNFNQFGNTIYQGFTRNLDPQWQQNQNQFAQQMAGQGLTAGTQAYDNAYADFNRSRTDAYQNANNAALQGALGAQQQYFGQNLSQSQLANALARAQLESQTALGTANIGANASMYNAGLQRDTSMDTNALNRELGLGDLGIRGDTLNMAGQNQDFNQLLGLLNFGSGQDQYNNSLLNSDFARGQGLLGLIPNVNPGNIDANGAYQINQAGVNNNYNAATAQANGTNSAIGQGLGTALQAFLMFCDRNAKEPLGEAPSVLEAMKTLPVEMWRYKLEGTPHIGTYAQDWNKAMNLPDRPFIDMRDAFGAILGAIKELIGVTDGLCSRLDALEAR
jgi:hypothetical protein